jgi:hypothetical protein
MASRARRKREREAARDYLAMVPKPVDVAAYLDELRARRGPTRVRARVHARAVDQEIAELVRRYDVRRCRRTFAAGEVTIWVTEPNGTVTEYPMGVIEVDITEPDVRGASTPVGQTPDDTEDEARARAEWRGEVAELRRST